MLLKRLFVILHITNPTRLRDLLPILVMSITGVFGFLSFTISSLVGFVIAKILSGRVTGKRGWIPSIILPLKNYKIHLHHWVICLLAIAYGLIRDPFLLPAQWFYGFLVGIVFQGIWSYGDWRKILTRRRRGHGTDTHKQASNNEGKDKAIPDKPPA